MRKSFTHALAAALYIVIIVLAIGWGGQALSMREDTILIPMTMLSLFVLSAAIMGFLFLAEPICLYWDGQKKEAITFFGQTVGFFAGFCLVFIIILILI